MQQETLRALKLIIKHRIGGWIDATKHYNGEEVTINKMINDFRKRYALDDEVFTDEMLTQMYYRAKNGE